jgi:predicted PurR-regulated permease PerM
MKPRPIIPQGIDNKALLKTAAILAVIGVSFVLASFFPMVAMILIASAVISFLLSPVVRFLEFRLGLRRSLGALVIFLIAGASLVFGGIQLIPRAVERLRMLVTQFSDFPWEAKLNEAAADLARSFPIVDASTISGKVTDVLNSFVEQAGSVLTDAVSIVGALAVIPFVTYFMLTESRTASKNIIRRIPNKYFEMTLNVVHKIRKDLVGYLRGWIVDSVVIGLLSMIGLYLIGIDYPILIGAIAGAANLIPYLGPVVGVVPAFLVSVTQYGDFRMVLPIIILTLTIQAIDNVIVQPIAFSKNVDMHPLTVILVLIIGHELMGVVGMLVAIPMATILKVSALETYWGLKNFRITR